jgi:hypothetical protein
MSKTLVVAVAQPESALHDVAFNADRHAAAVRSAGLASSCSLNCPSPGTA